MKKFETPEIEVTRFEVSDVIATSPDVEVGDNQTPPAVRP